MRWAGGNLKDTIIKKAARDCSFFCFKNAKLLF